MTMARSIGWLTVARLLLAACLVGAPAPALRAQTDTSGQPTTPQAAGPQATDAPFQAPWTQEKQIPPEVKEKEKETPTAWCPKPQKDGTTDWEVSYYNAKTGAITSIRYGTRPTADGKGRKAFWKITVKTPGQPKQETTYDREPGKETKTVQTGNDAPKTTTVDPAKDLATPAQTATAQATTPAPQTGQAPTTQGNTPSPTTPAPEQKPTGSTPQPTPTTPGPSGGPLPTTPAAGTPPPTPTKPGDQPPPGQTPTTPQAGTPPPPASTPDKTPTGPPPVATTWNLKPVTWGGPPPETTITYEPDHPTTPTQVAKRPEEPPGQPTPQNPWQPGDDQGPQTGIPTGGQPGGGQPGGGQPGGGQPGGGWINIGFGWAATRVPVDVLGGCTTEDGGAPFDEAAGEKDFERKRDLARTVSPPNPPTPTAPPPTTEQPPPPGTTPGPTPVGTTSTTPTPTTPTPTTPIATTPPKSVCGPDITVHVLEAMKELSDKYRSLGLRQAKNACDALVSLETAEYAWDIKEFFLEHGEYPSAQIPQGAPSFLETMTNSKCCQPRYPCGPTVEFFGACYNMQVVNYILWGLTRSLCPTSVNLQQSVAQTARNIRSPDKASQELMTEVGERFANMLLEGGDRTKSPLSLDKFPELKDLINQAEAASTRAEKACATECGKLLNAGEASAVKGVKLRGTWMGVTSPVGQRDITR